MPSTSRPITSNSSGLEARRPATGAGSAARGRAAPPGGGVLSPILAAPPGSFVATSFVATSSLRPRVRADLAAGAGSAGGAERRSGERGGDVAGGRPRVRTEERSPVAALARRSPLLAAELRTAFAPARSIFVAV